MSFPTKDRLAQARYMLWDSPKYTYVTASCMSSKQKGLRTLVLTNDPLTTRDKAVEAFNHDSSGVDVCVVSMALSALGLNFHHQCLRDIILEQAANVCVDENCSCPSPICAQLQFPQAAASVRNS
ncbi:unnamed protein product [Clonostachys rosea]|uniref:Helicase C-terminal domain-containing protein n=1 Tax=Bionectria ochroleuca TaxID=29856 RepID=A0ABY6UFW3_BIOOC|nr:unnamed protein product [Clonostachys rosea]